MNEVLIIVTVSVKTLNPEVVSRKDENEKVLEVAYLQPDIAGRLVDYLVNRIVLIFWVCSGVREVTLVVYFEKKKQFWKDQVRLRSRFGDCGRESKARSSFNGGIYIAPIPGRSAKC